MLLSSRFVQVQCHRLQTALTAGPHSDGFVCRYGFVIHPRREPDGVIFGLLTPAGESLPLTRRLVEDLTLTRLRLVDGTELTLAPEPSAWCRLDDAMTELRMTFYRNPAWGQETVAVAWTSRAAELPQPALILVGARPRGWPL